MERKMKFKIIAHKTVQNSSFEALCYVADPVSVSKEPKDFKHFPQSVLTTFESFKKKKLLDSTEITSSKTNTLITCPLPQKKGLNEDEQFRLAGTTLYQTCTNRSIKKVLLEANYLTLNQIKALVEGFSIHSYTFNKYKSAPKASKKLEVTFSCPEELVKNGNALLKEAQIILNNIALCRDLVNEPGENLNPQSYAERVSELAKTHNLSLKIRGEKELEKDGFTGLLAVGKGSQISPRLLTLSYDNQEANPKKEGNTELPHLVLLGKGVTFDTGGISLKPGGSMWEMKCDMAGSATVLCALLAISQLKLKVKVTAILALAENRPGLAAILPGDIFKAKNGKTIMVENTDAEGRLVLTDGLAEAGEVKATHIIDVATLTGAIVRALGTSIAGLFANEDDFADQIKQHGASNGEKFWQMPLEAEYRPHIEDTVADIKNLGKPEGGAISAALFLQEFVPAKTTWAHLDIAATAFITSPWKYFTPGATGWGVKTLIETARSFE